MKVLHLTTSLSGGAGIASARVNNALNLIGVDSTILSRNSFIDHSKLSSIQTLFSSANTLLQSKVLQNSNDLVTPLSVNIIDRNANILNSADLIHVHSYYNFLNTSLLKFLVAMRKPIFFTLHDQRLFTGGCHYSRDCNNYLRNCSQCPQVKTPFRFLVKNSFQNYESIFADAKNIVLISPSIWLKDKAKESKILRNIPIKVLKNPIPRIFSQYPINLNSKQDELRIAFIAAQIDNPYKGLSVFIQAVNKIASINRAKITVVLIGKGGDVIFDPLVQIQRSTVASDEEMAKVLSEIDILVVPSSQDNSPSVIGEALCMGVTVLGSRIGGITEILDEFRMPTFVVGEYGQLASKILDITEFKRKEEIREKSKEYFSEESIARKLLGFYQEAILKCEALY